jgi:hypothetical protein
MGVQIGATLVKVDERDAFAELSEVHRQVDGHEALADATTPASDRDDSIRRARGMGIGCIAVVRAPRR